MTCKSMQDTHTVKCDKCEIEKPAREMWRSKKYNMTFCEKHRQLFFQEMETTVKKELYKINNPFKWLHSKLVGNPIYIDIVQGFYKGDSSCSFLVTSVPPLNGIISGNKQNDRGRNRE